MGLWSTVQWILDTDYPVNAKHGKRRTKKSKEYLKNHKKANFFEKLRFGAPKFKKLNKIINKVIPKGQLAGVNTKRGEIKVHKNIPTGWARREVAFHETIENKLMRGWKIKDWSGRGKNLRINWVKPQAVKNAMIAKESSRRRVEDAMKHQNVLGAGAKVRERAHLTPNEKYAVVMKEYYRGTLHSSDGSIVRRPDVARAIAYSEARRVQLA